MIWGTLRQKILNRDGDHVTERNFPDNLRMFLGMGELMFQSVSSITIE